MRVKRRLEDDPVDSLVLLCKKVKTGTDDSSATACHIDSTEAVKNVFKFAGTVSGAVSIQCLQLTRGVRCFLIVFYVCKISYHMSNVFKLVFLLCILCLITCVCVVFLLFYLCFLSGVLNLID